MISFARALAGNIQRLERDLQTVRTLMRLEEDGMEVFCAVDFSEIYTYAFPMDSVGDRLRRNPNQGLEEESNLRISLGFLLGKNRDILHPQITMLPQHSLEMNDVLARSS